MSSQPTELVMRLSTRTRSEIVDLLCRKRTGHDKGYQLTKTKFSETCIRHLFRVLSLLARQEVIAQGSI